MDDKNKKYKKISFCIPCMGRAHHLIKTLPDNINHNSNYKNVEFVILDYSSNDNLSEWIKEKMMVHINNGILNYYRYDGAGFWHDAHAKNMALRLGCGDIVCNLDADNYTGEDFAFYINENLDDKSFLIPLYIQEGNFIEINGTGITGRLALYKGIFVKCGGYNEEMRGWGYADIDLYKRLFALEYEPRTIELKYLSAIIHSDEERKKNLLVDDIGNNDVGDPISGSNYQNFLISQQNFHKKKYIANNNKFGCGKVLKNFSEDVRIL